MGLHTIDPLSDIRWSAFVAAHSKATVFHHPRWLSSLADTYGYQPLALTSTGPNAPLSDGIVFCKVRSRITGNRLVSLPFADHCELLVNDQSNSPEFTEWMRSETEKENWRYVEVRPISWSPDANSQLTSGNSYWYHTLELTSPIEQIFRSLHKDSLQRRIRHAERERLSYVAGRSEELLSDFYRLLLITKRRHHLPPQPRAWFRNLISKMGDYLQIHVARKDSRPIAALLTLRHRNMAVYKYGCSDERFHHLAGIPFLFWRFIEESKTGGAEQIDFGRSDLDQEGLINFKDHFGTTRRMITYWRYSRVEFRLPHEGWSVARRLFSVLPDALSPITGSIVYRHLG